MDSDRHIKPLPRLRHDININFYKEKDEILVILQDPFLYATYPIVVNYNLYLILQVLDGKMNAGQLEELIKSATNAEIDLAPVLDDLKNLEELGFMECSSFFERKSQIDREYLATPNRKPVCAGNTYSDDPVKLKTDLEFFFATADKNAYAGNSKAIIVPHIDFKIGKKSHETYAAGYHSIRNSDADLFVIFGTAHSANSDYFMLSEKDFETPLGIVETDRELIDRLKEELPFELTVDEFAHKPEHSIELQTVLLKHYFAGKDFKILPVLVGSFYNFIINGKTPESSAKFGVFTETLKKIIDQAGRKAVYIASVDFAHIGRKFDDEFDAESQLPLLKSEDEILINSLVNCDEEHFFEKIKNDGDKWKICGTAPIYALMKTYKPSKGTFLKYNQWNEIETRSAVSFASISFE